MKKTIDVLDSIFAATTARGRLALVGIALAVGAVSVLCWDRLHEPDASAMAAIGTVIVGLMFIRLLLGPREPEAE